MKSTLQDIVDMRLEQYQACAYFALRDGVTLDKGDNND